MPEQKTPRDYLAAFHSFASQHGQETEHKSLVDHNRKVKEKVAGILSKLNGSKEHLEKLRQTDPKAYDSMMSMVHAMVSMAREYVVPHNRSVPQPVEQAPKMEQAQQEPIQKAQGQGRIATIHGPAGSVHQSGADARHHTKTKVDVAEPASGDKKIHLRQMDEGQTTDDEGNVVSALRRKAQLNRGQSNPGPVGPVTH